MGNKRRTTRRLGGSAPSAGKSRGWRLMGCPRRPGDCNQDNTRTTSTQTSLVTMKPQRGNAALPAPDETSSTSVRPRTRARKTAKCNAHGLQRDEFARGLIARLVHDAVGALPDLRTRVITVHFSATRNATAKGCDAVKLALPGVMFQRLSALALTTCTAPPEAVAES